MDFNRQFTGKEEKAMAKEYAKSFYKSDKWLQCKKSFIAERRAIDGGLCQRCRKRYGYIVHHRQHITPENITDPMVTLSHTNLEYLCQECHNKEHFGDAGLRYMIGEDGQPMPPLPQKRASPLGTDCRDGKNTQGSFETPLPKIYREELSDWSGILKITAPLWSTIAR